SRPTWEIFSVGRTFGGEECARLVPQPLRPPSEEAESRLARGKTGFEPCGGGRPSPGFRLRNSGEKRTSVVRRPQDAGRSNYAKSSSGVRSLSILNQSGSKR